MRRKTKCDGLLLLCLWATTVMAVGAPHAIELKDGAVDPDGRTVWYDAQHLGVEGKGWIDTESTYERLPRKAKGVVTKNVWKYGHCSAGLSVRFATDAANIHVRWTLAHKNEQFAHLSDLGVNGIDLYYRNETSGKLRHRPGDFNTIYPKGIVNTSLFNLPKSREYVLNLPPYNTVTRLEIGIPKGKTLSKLSAPAASKSIVFYGTSITQGAHVSRPGMAATTIVRRRLGVPVINLGMCGSGKMEMEMADLLSELDPAVYVLDCLWNMDARILSKRVEPFIKRLRKSRPTTPIVLAEDSHYDDLPTKKGDILRKISAKLIAQGDTNLYFLSNKGMLGEDGDGVADDRHPNDLGMARQAAVFMKFLEPILAKQKLKHESNGTGIH